MASVKDNAYLLEHDYRQRSVLHRKIHLTIPVCVLLVTVFVLSATIVSVVSYYRTGSPVCFVENDRPVPAEPQRMDISRPKRSLPVINSRLPCFGFGCCVTPLDPSKPWENQRLPKNVNPIEYQLTMAMYELNQPTDTYSGDITIVVEIVAPTSEIILHGVDLLYSDVTVAQHYDANRTDIPVECVIPFPATETLIIHLNKQLAVGTTYDVRIQFFRALNIRGTGIFELQFNKDQFGLQVSRMILTHFEAVHAREAYPCFDEPGFKAKFQLTVRHENNTKIVSNWDEAGTFSDEISLQTEFQTVPPIPTALTAFAIFYTDDFQSRTVTVNYPNTGRTLRVTLWARSRYFTNDNGIYVDAPLDMIRRILTGYLSIFQEIENPIVPTTLTFLAVPEYPSDAVSHWGLMVFTERALLHNPATLSELEHQHIALLVAKELAEQWYGNAVSFEWWTDLWLQEAIANFLKYHAVDLAYPQWNVRDQFAPEELFSTMMDDSMSTSHPVMKSVNSAAQINELYDDIEITKATAILRMADYYMEQSTTIRNNTLFNIVSFLHDREYGFLIPDEFLSKYRIGTWRGTDFFDRWLLQSNFPTISARMIRNPANNETFLFQLQQSRYLSARQYDNDLYPPETNPFGYVWYVPISCSFGNDTSKFVLTRIFYLDQPAMNVSFGTLDFKYFYCNTGFAGYYIMDYTLGNWEELSASLLDNNTQLTPLDRANLLHNVFLDAQSSDESYRVVREVTQFLLRNTYSDLLPWQALSYHVNRMLDVLEYESLFAVVQKYFRLVVRGTYRDKESTLWTGNGLFTEQIFKQTIIQLACRLELSECIDKVTLLWYDAASALVNGDANHSVAAHARPIVYRTHFRNTYNDSEWLAIESDYHTFVDVQEREHLLQALTQSRQPWHLYQLLYREAELNIDRDLDLLDLLTLLAQNPVGRELVWLYYRRNWAQLQADYGRENQRLGQLLIDITATFEDEFHELELIDFLALTPGTENNVDARFWSLERANMNFWWVIDNRNDITEAFDTEIRRRV